MNSMRHLITIMERTAKPLREAVNTREMVFYHGTRSGAFSRFDPTLAAKGSQHWNPLGTGLYATDQIKYAALYGTPHKVVIPPGYRYKQIHWGEWQRLGYNLIMRGVDKALARHGFKTADWEYGDPDPNWVAPKPEKFKTTGPVEALRDTLVDIVVRIHPEKTREEIKAVVAQQPDDKIAGLIKVYAKKLPKPKTSPPRTLDPKKRDRFYRFRHHMLTVAEDNPRNTFTEAFTLVDQTFGDEIAETFKQTVTEEADKLFGKYDFVIFFDSEDDRGYQGHDGKYRGAKEVVIFNPDLQKIVPLDVEQRVSS